MNISKVSVLCAFLFSLSHATADSAGDLDSHLALGQWALASHSNAGTASYQKSSDCPKYAGHCPCFPVGGDVALSYDYFRSLSDGSWNGNSGAYASLNLGFGLSKYYGFGVQAGGSYGLYDWDGRGSNPTGNTKALQQQGFVSAGLFRVTPDCCGVNAGVVYDAMFNKQFGVFALNPFVSQVRGQIGYLFQGGNEVGVWATYNANTAHKHAQQIPVKFRAISQVNVFWTHYFKNQAQTMLWAGTPYRKGLMYSSGRAGRFIVGANFRAPLTKALSIIGHGSYMAASAAPVFIKSRNDAANICFGLNYSFGGCDAGQRPYLFLSDNSNFMVDTNLNQ